MLENEVLECWLHAKIHQKIARSNSLLCQNQNFFCERRADVAKERCKTVGTERRMYERRKWARCLILGAATRPHRTPCALDTQCQTQTNSNLDKQKLRRKMIPHPTTSLTTSKRPTLTLLRTSKVRTTRCLRLLTAQQQQPPLPAHS